MKKFLLIPTTLVTALLAVAFVSPAAASSAVRAVAPQIHFVGFSLASAPTVGTNASTTAGSSGTSSLGSASSTGNSTEASAAFQHLPPAVEFSIATPGQQNCGRFGDGFHGGKHLLVCPNRPFPPPPNH